jgi:glycosyltransferase involved in cell wall biosynthesis
MGLKSVGVVIIGRNEGNRLKACLLSVIHPQRVIVYVDSGSTDGSVELAKSLGVHVVQLDLSIPFTAARARNMGFEHLLNQIEPNLQFVQFVDGDCQVVAGWLELAESQLRENADLVVVCGRRQEQFPNNSIYNRLCDIEWDTPIGEAKACGGDSMMRVSAFKEVGGFNPSLIAGEEPELCVRLRHAGGRIMRLDASMTVHDAQIIRFKQWWRRSLRAGHAYAEGASIHGKPPELHWVKESRSIWFWGFVLPVGALALAIFTWGLSLLLLLMAYLFLGYRIYKSTKHRIPFADGALYSLFCVLCKFPQAQGQIQYHLSRLGGKQRTLVEYKEV